MPRLYAEGFDPLPEWDHGHHTEDAFVMGYPKYAPLVDEFFKVVSQEHWVDYDYSSKNAGQMIESEETIRQADIDQIKTMLTYYNRGERFSDGHWGALIRNGTVRRLLERLKDLNSAT